MCDGCSEIFKLAGLPQLMGCEWTFLTVLCAFLGGFSLFVSSFDMARMAKTSLS